MGRLDNRVAIITGAGRGLGREHALLIAAQGAKVVINDLGGSPDGGGAKADPAQNVVDEIVAAGGSAVANRDDISTWDGARALVSSAIETFGDLHVLVNNAGILRDRSFASMSEEDWDAVISVHLKGHFAPTRFAAEYWRDQAKSGREVSASVINTTSVAGLLGNRGQANYAAAKAGIAAMTMVCAKELNRYGVRTNAIAPYARTRLTVGSPGLEQIMAAPEDPTIFDLFDPANVSPLVAYLASANCPINGGVFHVLGGQIGLFEGWRLTDTTERLSRWTLEDLEAQAERFLRPDRLASEGTNDAEIYAALARAAGQ